jgi:hypothetical protein
MGRTFREVELEAMGFSRVGTAEHTCLWTGRDGEELLELLYRSIVRAPLLIEAQASGARERIKASIVERAEALRRGDRVELRFPYALVTATRP